MPWIGPVIGGVVGLIGDSMSSSSQQQTNVMSAEEAQKNRDWQTQMSNTQMQRRVDDYKSAGLNPVLAAGGPGASMGSPVMPSFQNPGGAFANMGQQATSAMQLYTQKAQVDLMKAQADKANAETTQQIPAQVEKIQSEIGLNQSRATEVNKNVQLLDWALLQAPEKLAQVTIQTHLMQADQQERQDTLLTLIRARNDEQFARAIGARNIANASDGEFGRIMSYFKLAAPVTSAIGAIGGGAIGGAVGRGVSNLMSRPGDAGGAVQRYLDQGGP